MRRKVSSKENIPVQATSFTGQFASFALGLGGNFLDHPLSGSKEGVQGDLRLFLGCDAVMRRASSSHNIRLMH